MIGQEEMEEEIQMGSAGGMLNVLSHFDIYFSAIPWTSIYNNNYLQLNNLVCQC